MKYQNPLGFEVSLNCATQSCVCRAALAFPRSATYTIFFSFVQTNLIVKINIYLFGQHTFKGGFPNLKYECLLQGFLTKKKLHKLGSFVRQGLF